MSHLTRSHTEVYLIGQPKLLDPRFLPTKCDVLQHYYESVKGEECSKKKQSYDHLISCTIQTKFKGNKCFQKNSSKIPLQCNYSSLASCLIKLFLKAICVRVSM